MTNTNNTAAASPTIAAAMEATIAHCAAHRITDPAEMMAIMDRTVRAYAAELEATLAARRDEIATAVLGTIWTEIRTDAGLAV